MDNIGNKRIVTKIPADVRKQTRVQPGRKLKVAAYCRVSTDDEDQLNSYRVQMDYYTKYIMGNDDWEFAGIYADEGITGTQAKKRGQFLKMIRDCEKGKIDMILTKSISRYARNVVDSLSYLRKLKAMGISIYFEEQHIDSLKEENESYIGFFSVMAQNESESTSANVRWGISKRMENGSFCSNMNMYGYRWDKVNREARIVPEEAEVVRNIFGWFLDGLSTHQIVDRLMEKGIKTYSGGSNWQHSSIKSMLKNEKYCGDIMYQKTFTTDCITKKKITNTGEKARYIVYNDHKPIISRDIFYQAQAEFAKRNTYRSASDLAATCKGRYSGKYAFSQILVCADCGGRFRRKTVRRNGKVKYYWRCINRLDYADKYCSNSQGFEEEALKSAVCNALSKTLSKNSAGFELVKSQLIYAVTGDENSDNLFFLDSAIKDEEKRIAELAELGMKSQNNKENYEEAIADCMNRIVMLREKRDENVKQLNYNDAAKAEIERIESYLTEDRAVVDRFDDATVRRLINSITLSADGEIVIYLKGGYEIKEEYLPLQKKVS